MSDTLPPRKSIAKMRFEGENAIRNADDQGLAFRKFAKSWPGYPRMDVPTDKDKHLSVLVARATYSQTPFERLSKDGYAFAGLVEYELLEKDVSIFVPGQEHQTPDPPEPAPDKAKAK